MTVRLTAELIESFAGTFLSPMYDLPKPTPDFHREIWNLYCSDHTQCAVAAPRNHAKSTALTHDYGLAVALFREQNYIIILGATEEMAIEHLGDIATELRENEDLRREFRIGEFLTDQKTDIIVQCQDGYQFRLIARGGEQKIRGKKWHGSRPGLIIGDDIEDDEQVESKERRSKFFRWLLRAAKQALRDGGKIRLHGTILHEDAALAKIMRMPSWHTLKFRAHKSFDDFSEILWEEKFPESRLRDIRQQFIEGNDATGYAQEYLNDPHDRSDVYLRKEDFLPMGEEDYESQKIVCAAADLAVSKADHANNSSITVGGKDVQNTLHIIDQRKGKWHSLELIDEFFMVQKRWAPDIFWVEDGQIWKSIAPMIRKEMLVRDVWINFIPIPSTKDKATRGRTLQRRHRGGGMRFDKGASWYPDYEYELLRFSEGAEAEKDDQFDSTSLLCIGFERLAEVDEEDFKTDEDIQFEREDPRIEVGRSPATGY